MTKAPPRTDGACCQGGRACSGVTFSHVPAAGRFSQSLTMCGGVAASGLLSPPSVAPLLPAPSPPLPLLRPPLPPAAARPAHSPLPAPAAPPILRRLPRLGEPAARRGDVRRAVGGTPGSGVSGVVTRRTSGRPEAGCQEDREEKVEGRPGHGWTLDGPARIDHGLLPTSTSGLYWHRDQRPYEALPKVVLNPRKPVVHC